MWLELMTLCGGATEGGGSGDLVRKGLLLLLLSIEKIFTRAVELVEG